MVVVVVVRPSAIGDLNYVVGAHVQERKRPLYSSKPR